MINLDFPLLKTHRLYMREHSIEDNMNYFQLFSNMDAIRFYGRKPIISMQDAIKEIITMHQMFLNSEAVKWAIIRTHDNQYIGCAGIKGYTNIHRRGTLSCIISPDLWGNGYAHEALSSIIHFGFSTLRLNRIQAFVDPQNIKAINLFNNLGFKYEATLKEYDFEYGKHIDIAIFGLTTIQK